MFMLRFAAPSLFYGTIPLLLLAFFIRYKKSQRMVYTSSLARLLIMHGFAASPWYGRIIQALRIIVLVLLAFCCARPQLVDVSSQVTVDGIDIVLTLDASGSMQFADYAADKQTRFDVAKEEAIRFVSKRHNDAIGLVIFGNDALSRIPVTHDKKMLTTMINDLNLGDIDPNGTKLATALLSAANRLKRSTSKSKVIILLTDGEPSEGDIDPQKAIAVVKQLGIKVYTIGIGSEQQDYFIHPLYGMIAKPQVNKKLLDYIADQTGGKSFMAHNADDMRAIYNTIDQLEKTEHEVPIFSNYRDLFWYCSWTLLALICIEPILLTFMWFGL